MASDDDTEKGGEDAGDEDRPSVPQTKKGTLLGAGTVKNPLLAAADLKYAKKVPLSQPPPPMQVPVTDAAKPADAKGGAPKPPPSEESSGAPPPPPPPSVTDTAPLSKPPAAPPPPRRMPPSPIKGVPKPGKTKLGVPAAEPEDPGAPFPLAPSALGDGSEAPSPFLSEPVDSALPTSNPLGDPRTIMIGGGVAAAVLLLLIIIVGALSGGDDEEIADADETVETEGSDEIETIAQPSEESDPSEDGEAQGPREEPIELVELTPEQHDEFEQLRASARHHYGAGRFLEAAQDYRAAAQIDPTHAGTLAGLGASLSNAGQLEGAAVAYREAARVDPHSSGFRAALGRVLRANGDEEGAIEAYRLALELDEENQAAQTALREMGAD